MDRLFGGLVAVLAGRPRMQAGLGLCSAARAPQAAMQPSPRTLRSFGDDSFNDLVGADDMPPEVGVEPARLMPCSITYHEISRDDEIECGAKDTITQWNVGYR